LDLRHFTKRSVLNEAQFFKVSSLVSLLEGNEDAEGEAHTLDAHDFMETVVKQQRQIVDYHRQLGEMLKTLQDVQGKTQEKESIQNGN